MSTFATVTNAAAVIANPAAAKVAVKPEGVAVAASEVVPREVTVGVLELLPSLMQSWLMRHRQTKEESEPNWGVSISFESRGCGRNVGSSSNQPAG